MVLLPSKIVIQFQFLAESAMMIKRYSRYPQFCPGAPGERATSNVCVICVTVIADISVPYNSVAVQTN